MRAFRTVPALLALFVGSISIAAAQDPLEGEFDLAGRYSTSRGTEAVLKITRASTGRLSIERTGRYTARRYASLAPHVWRSTEAVRRNRTTVDVTYRLNGGLVGGLVAQGEVLRARYVVSSSGTLREHAINLTRRGAERWWSSLTTSGARRVSPQALTLTTDHPGARLERVADTWVLSSDTTGSEAALGRRATATLTLGALSIPLTANASGFFSLAELPLTLPDGFGGQVLMPERVGDVVRAPFRLAADPVGGPTFARAQELARAGLVDHIQRVRMHEDDWKDYFPDTWPALLAAGIMSNIDAFVDPTQGTEVHRMHDRFLFVGRGPYDLYTEVDVSKTDGSIIRVYIEID